MLNMFLVSTMLRVFPYHLPPAGSSPHMAARSAWTVSISRRARNQTCPCLHDEGCGNKTMTSQCKNFPTWWCTLSDGFFHDSFLLSLGGW